MGSSARLTDQRISAMLLFPEPYDCFPGQRHSIVRDGCHVNTFRTVKVPKGTEWIWGVVASDPRGGEFLRDLMYDIEAEAQAEVDRLTAAERPEPR
jgi:hypothetical protein